MGGGYEQEIEQGELELKQAIESCGNNEEKGRYALPAALKLLQLYRDQVAFLNVLGPFETM